MTCTIVNFDCDSRGGVGIQAEVDCSESLSPEEGARPPLDAKEAIIIRKDVVANMPIEIEVVVDVLSFPIKALILSQYPVTKTVVMDQPNELS